MWRGIHDGWESFSKHVTLVVGDGTRILFWHDKWVGDNSLKRLYPQLYARKHGRGTRGAAPASDAVARMSVRVYVFFFLGFALTRLDSCRISFDSHRTGLIWPKSGCIGHIGSYRPAADTGWKRPIQAGNGWYMPDTAEIGLEYGRKSRNLPSSFFFCESRHSNVFFKNILIVKIYRKYK